MENCGDQTTDRLKGELEVERQEIHEDEQRLLEDRLREAETKRLLAEAEAAPFTIFVNSRPKIVTGPRISFEAVAELAYGPAPAGVQVTYTITYWTRDVSHTLTARETVELCQDMAFNVTETSRS